MLDEQDVVEATRDYEMERVEEIEAYKERYEVAQSWMLHHQKKANDYKFEMYDLAHKIGMLGGQVI